ncbi:MAG: helix-hairpin-helix domain-containing protein [Dehalococcoidia bacterium]|nr:helix-hairpin-helix domain-containing protein [Dehalococcoidia bacterium]
MTERLDRFWVGVAATLLTVAVAGVLTFLLLIPGRSSPLVFEHPAATTATPGQVFISGSVANPGLYPLRQDDTLDSLLVAAGSAIDSGGASSLSLIVSPAGASAGPQKVNLNRAEPWLLESVPGVGPSTASAIVAYRDQHGPFRMVQDLLAVKGIGEITLQRIAPYVTVGE